VADLAERLKDTQSSSGLAKDLAKAEKPRWRLAAIFAMVLGLGTLTVAVGNYMLAPLTYNGNAIREAAEALAGGHNIAVRDLNMDWRTLRKEQIARLSARPDILIFGGSRWQAASGSLVPGKTMINAFVSSDHYEDMLAITKILLDADKLPQTLMLSVRYSTFETFDQRPAADWKVYGEDYRAMARQLGVPAHTWLETLPVQNGFNLLSLDALVARWRDWRKTPRSWWTTPDLIDPTASIVGADGALHFSKAREEQANEQASLQNALRHAAEDKLSRLKIDPDGISAVTALLQFLKNKGVRVILAQSPFHPAYFAGIKGSAYYDDLMAVEDTIAKIAHDTGIEVYGSFDATALGCVAADFRDYHHARENCLGKITAQIWKQ
jgi:hypothetical protein